MTATPSLSHADLPPSSGAALEVRGLRKAYVRRVVLDDVRLTLEPGSVVALVGPNGAGKSTLLGCIVGTVIPDAGQIRIGGHDLRAEPIAARRALRWLPQEVEVPTGLTGREILHAWADIYGDREHLARAEALAELGDALEHLATTYSVGMRKRLMLAAMTTGRAALYVLDEPFAGIDAAGRARVCAWLDELRRRGAAILLAAHDADELELRALDAGKVAVGAVST
jgi:ABC-type multidrug transport system ATPase subunit